MSRSTYHYGDTAKVDAAFAGRACDAADSPSATASSSMRSSRARRSAAIDANRAASRCTLGCQGVFGLRANSRRMLGVAADKVRVLTDNVGGSFGMKVAGLPGICLRPACGARARPAGEMDRRALRELPLRPSRPRPRDDRRARARRRRHHFLAVRLTGYGNAGAYLGGAAALHRSMPSRTWSSVYRTPLLEVSTKGMLHQHHAGRRLSRRRAARRQLLHGAADRHRRRRDGHRPLELRRRNHIAPEAMPLQGAVGDRLYDSGDFAGGARQGARHLADWQGFAARKRESRRARQAARARHRQLSRSDGAARARRWAASASRSDGSVTMITGTLDYGQGHASPFAQVIVEPARHSRSSACGSCRATATSCVVRRRHRRLALGDGRAARRSSRPATRWSSRARRSPRIRARGRRRRHRIRRRPLRHRRHRPRASASRSSRRTRESGAEAAAGAAAIARRDARHRDAALGLSQWLPRRRGRDRSRDRRASPSCATPWSMISALS